MTRILHISTRLILGGSQENTVLSCEGQARLGHDVHLAFGPIYGPEGSMLERVERFRTGDDRAITTHEVPDLIREIHPRRDRRALMQIRSLIEQIQPDVVHTHSSKAGVLGRAAGWSVWKRNPERTPAVVHTIHGPPFMPIEGGVLSRAKSRIKNEMYAVSERYAAKRCHTIAAVADAMTEQFLTRRIGHAAQYVTVRSGMETEPYLHAAPGEDRASVRSELGIAPDDFVVGTVARLAQHKGHDDLLDALADDLRADPSFKLLWVGDGWWADRLLERVRGLGLERRVVSTGLVPPGRIPALMRAMDVLAHPSYREGLPRTVPQALLAGVPVVAHDVDGTREACLHERTGLLVPPGDRAVLRESVLRLQRDDAMRERLSAEGRAWCAAEFAAERMVDRLESVYHEALRRANGAEGS